ncbi:MAG: hypothetical protein K8953_11880, partial [Proteobacteria bacterium]|nr:hypothetical protein [Pseudomonadota bacterium]
CTGSGKEANPFDDLCIDANIDTLTEKKKSFIQNCDSLNIQTLLGRATCSVEITTCLANPFDTTGEGCDPAAYEDVLADFCADPTTTFNNNCRDGMHGDAGAVNTAREQLALSCRTAGNTGCSQPINGINGLSVADCSANPYLTTDGCFENDAFVTERMRFTMCVTAGTSFDTLCDIEDKPNTHVGTVTAIRVARGTNCAGLDVDARDGRCGNEDGIGGTYIAAYCATGNTVGAHNNARDCPTTAYADANPNLSQSDNVALADFTASNTNQPLNSTGTALLPAFAAPQNPLSEHGDANFIVGLRDSLLLTPFAGQTLSNDSTLTLGALADTPAPTNDGFALGTITTTVTSAQKLYVGFLSNTSLGNPVT